MNEPSLALSVQELDRLLACADGNCALLYLHIARHGSFSLTKAARELKLSESQVALAADTLRRLGLLETAAPPLPSGEMPEYTAQDIVRRARSDASFEGIVFEAQQALGKLLSSNDLKVLFGIYDHLGLPAEVLLLLIHHCIETWQERSGPGRMPSLRYIEKEAWFWAEQEILSYEAAEEHIRREAQKKDLGYRIKEALQIRGRELTPGEKKYIESWIDLGYGPEALSIAYDRTVLGTGKLTWKYMDKIVRSWAEKQLFSPEEIRLGDARQTKKPLPDPREQEDQDLEYMRRMYAHMLSRDNEEK